jgi:hypothetical protein
LVLQSWNPLLLMLLLLLLLCVQDWLQEAGTVPPGNGAESALWEGEEVSEADLIARMSPTERAAYEEKKLKMRKAMVSVCPAGGGPLPLIPPHHHHHRHHHHHYHHHHHQS